MFEISLLFFTTIYERERNKKKRKKEIENEVQERRERIKSYTS